MKDIVIKNISKSYGETVVFDNFSATIPCGKTTYLKAPSGKGKTTLLRLLMQLEKSDSGEIEGIFDQKISAVFQENRLCENLSAIKNISFTTKKSEEIIATALVEMGLEGFENEPVKNLSGGMKRRVAIVRALLVDFEILLLDEPFKGLDDKNKSQVIDFLKRNSLGKIVVLVTHNDDEAEEMSCFSKIEL